MCWTTSGAISKTLLVLLEGGQERRKEEKKTSPAKLTSYPEIQR